MTLAQVIHIHKKLLSRGLTAVDPFLGEMTGT
jgi:hypothetical protein